MLRFYCFSQDLAAIDGIIETSGCFMNVRRKWKRRGEDADDECKSVW